MQRIARMVRDQWMGALALFLVIAGGTAYAANTVRSTDIVNGQVKTPDLANDAVTSDKVLDGQIASVDLANNSVRAAQVAPNAISTSEVKDDSILSTDLGPGSVGNHQLQGSAVGQSEIADNAVTSFKIGDGQVFGNDIANGTIAGSKVTDNSLTGDDIDTNTLDDEIADGGVTSAKLSDDAITSRIYTRSAVSPDDATYNKEVSAACDAGDTVIGGGYVLNTHGVTSDVQAERSYAVDPRTWLVRAQLWDCANVSCPYQITVIANCVG